MFDNFFLSEDFANAEVPVAGKPGVQQTNHAVDITIQDEALPNDDSAPLFFVGTDRQMLAEEDIAENHTSFSKSGAEKNVPQDLDTIPAEDLNDAQPADIQKKERSDESMVQEKRNDGFVPMPLQETVVNMSGKEAKPVHEVNTEKTALADGGNDMVIEKDDTLDTLPDLQTLDIKGSSNDDIVEDSDFSVSSGSKAAVESDPADKKDTVLMAKAISTILAKE